MLDCRRAHDSLSASIDGTLPWWKRILLRVHLRICPGCARTDQSLRKCHGVVASLRDVPPIIDDDAEP